MAWKGSCREVGRGWEGAEERGSSRRGGGGLSQVEGVANRACKHAHAAFPWDEASLYARYNTALKTYTLLPCSLNVCSRAHTSWGDEVGREREGGRGGASYSYIVSPSIYHEHDNTTIRYYAPPSPRAECSSWKTRGKQAIRPVIDFNESRGRDRLIESSFKKKILQ